MTPTYPLSSSTSGEHIDYELSQELLDELSQPSGSYDTSDFLDSYAQHFVDPRLLLGPNERAQTPLGSCSVFGNRRGIMDSNPSSAPTTPPSELDDLPTSSAHRSKQASSGATSATTTPSSSSDAAAENIMPALLVPAPTHLIHTHRNKLKAGSSSSSSVRTSHKTRSKEGKSRSSRSVDAVSSSSSLIRKRASSSSAASTVQHQYSSAQRGLKLRIPKRLPAPQFRFLTNPHADVAKHLRRIGLEQDASNAQHDGWTAVYCRDRLREMLAASSSWRIAAEADVQSADTHPNLSTAAERSSIQVIDSQSGAQSAPPSHVLALLPSSSERLSSADQTPVLLPIHSLVYALQCLHLPDGYFSPTEMMLDEDSVSKDGATAVPVLKLHLPHPATFSITHEYLYTGSPQRLLIALIPVRLLSRGSHAANYWKVAHDAHQRHRRTGKQRSKLSNESVKASELVPELNTMPRRVAPDANSNSSRTSSNGNGRQQGSDRLPDSSELDVQERMVQALSFLPTSRLIDITVLIHSVWLNGAAVGLADRDYWNTLACAWDYVYQALALAQKRARYCEDRNLPADLDISRLDVASGV